MISFLAELAKRDLSERFAGSILGTTWAFIWPAVQLFIYIVIFGRIIGSKLPGTNQIYSYGIYVAAGLIPWTSFCNVVSRSTGIFLEKKHIISKIRVSLHSFPLFIVLSEAVIFVFSMAVLIAVAFLTGLKIPLSKILFLPFLYYIQQIFAFSIGLFFATFTVFLRDIKEVVDIILQLWFWFTPIVYIETILPAWVKRFVHLNPMYVFISTYHRIFILPGAIDFFSLFVMNSIAHFFFFLSVFFLKTFEKDVRDFL